MLGRVQKLSAIARVRDDGLVELLSPNVGYVRAVVPNGRTLAPEESLATLDILGEKFSVVVPTGVAGKVVSETRTVEGEGVAFKTILALVDPRASNAEASHAAESKSAAAAAKVFRTPMGGRYYAKPGPDADPFVRAGDTLKPGMTVAILEVMKTFNRVQWSGEDGAKVLRVVAKDGEDINAQDVLLELE